MQAFVDVATLTGACMVALGNQVGLRVWGVGVQGFKACAGVVCRLLLMLWTLTGACNFLLGSRLRGSFPCGSPQCFPPLGNPWMGPGSCQAPHIN